MTAQRHAPRLTARPQTSRVVGFDLRAAVILVLVSFAGLSMFVWPLLITPASGLAHGRDAPFVFVAILPCLLAVVLSEMTAGRLDTKAVAMLGVLAALGAALRPMGAGVAGIETVLFLLILGGRVYGPGFGFVLGALTLFASALITGGVGPWLPFQMLAAAWVGLGAGLLPRARGRAEITLLAAYGVVSAYVYGFLLNLWFWPFATGSGTQLSYIPGASVFTNLHRFFVYTLASSTLGWDTGRALTNLAAILVIGPVALVTLRRAARRAAFGAPVVFADAPPSAGVGHDDPATG
jgi:energy-coupling factor transport system substrate-specific component